MADGPLIRKIYIDKPGDSVYESSMKVLTPERERKIVEALKALEGIKRTLLEVLKM